MNRAVALLTCLLLAPPALGAPPRAARAAVKDWSATITRTPAGAYVMGNPGAKVKVVEYASLTCSHCAAFAAEGIPALRADQVKRGLVSLEFRHAVRDRADLAASLLARCAGPRGYFAALERLFAAQPDWLSKAAAAPAPATAADTPAARSAALISTATAAGLPAIARLAPPVAAKCLASAPEQASLQAMSAEAWGKRRITGTPTFLINEKPADGATWGLLAPQIAAALR